MSKFYRQFFCGQNQNYSLIIEDDGRVAYGYLLFCEEIIGDLWLYNQDKTPTVSDWSDSDSMPFLNPQEFVLRNVVPILSEDDLKISWKEIKDEEFEVLIYIHGELIGSIEPEATPGFSNVVIKDGPLAKKMIND